MIKRIVPLFLMFAIMIVCNEALADYPEHLNGNPNYILCDGHQGIGVYVDKSSLNVQEYNPPSYRIAINVVYVSDADRGGTRITGGDTREFLYNWDEKKIYERMNGRWKYLNPNGSRAEGAYRVRAGEIAFQLAYNMHFGAR